MWMQQQYDHSETAIFKFPTVDVLRQRCLAATVTGIVDLMHTKVVRWRRWWIHYVSFLSNYCVKYCDYIIVKWSSGVACNWCVSLDVALIMASYRKTVVATFVLFTASVSIRVTCSHINCCTAFQENKGKLISKILLVSFVQIAASLAD